MQSTRWCAAKQSMGSEPKNNGTYQLITPPNTLKTRVGAGFGVDTALANKANSAVENMQDEFLQRVSTAVVEIAAQLSLVEQSEDESAEFVAEVWRISNDLLKQGEAFGYPLVSDVCTSLCGYIAGLGTDKPPVSQIVSAHIDVLRSVIGNSIDGDGGSVGKDLIVSLNVLVAKTPS